MRFPAWGVGGGRHGALLEATLNRGRADERRLGKIHELHVRKGDTITLNLPGGGGYGDPFERLSASVLADVEGGFVTPAAAERDYGVVITAGKVDAVATAAARQGRVGEKSADGFFDFGPDRRAWETVFSDAVMNEINRRLYELPKAVRQDVRRGLFEAAVPGIARPDPRPLAEMIPDPAAAQQRLRAALDALAAR